MKRWYYGGILTLVFLVSMVSAEVSFSQPNATYNRGDLLQLSAGITSSTTQTHPVIISLVCSSFEQTLYQQPLTLEAGGRREVAIEVPLISSVIQDAQGTCLLRGNFGSSVTESQSFSISSSLVVETTLDGSLLNPGQTIMVKGTARKENGAPANGIIRFFLKDLNISVSGPVLNGAFNLSLLLPRTISAGQHTVISEVTERDVAGEVLNQGTAEDNFSVRSILTSLVFSVVNETLMPGTNTAYQLLARDQSGSDTASEVALTIYTPQGKVYSQSVIPSLTEQTFATTASTLPGYWKLEGKMGELVVRKLIYVSEFEDAQFIMENQTLLIANTGNVPYSHAIQITLNNVTEVRQVSLPVGASKRFKLRAPDATYTVEVSDGSRTASVPGVLLTGRAIDIGEVSESSFSMMWIGIFLAGLLVLGLGTNMYVQKRRQRIPAEDAPIPAFKPLKKAVFSSNPEASASDAYTTGAKQEASVVAIRFDARDGTVSSRVERALDAHRAKATSIYAQGNHWIMVFDSERAGPDHGLQAIKAARALEQELASTLPQGSFGIGANKGEALVDKREQNRIMGFGTLIPLAKKLAVSAQGEFWVSEPLYRSIVSVVRAEKVNKQNAWRIKSVIDRDSHNSFLQGFLRRQGK